MLHHMRPDEDPDLLVSTDSGVEPESNSEDVTLRTDAERAAPPTPPKRPATVPPPKKAESAATPGSEYWLP